MVSMVPFFGLFPLYTKLSSKLKVGAIALSPRFGGHFRHKSGYDTKYEVKVR